MARPRVHVEQQLKNNRLSENQIIERTRIPVRIGEHALKMPSSVKLAPVAKKTWGRLMKIFEDKDFVSSSDAAVMERYCILIAEEDQLRTKVNAIIENDKSDLNMIAKASKMLDDKRRLITLIEDKLFLNPQAKMRGLPPAPPAKSAEQLELEGLGFGDI